jgi:para-nitrobenzyl esterase
MTRRNVTGARRSRSCCAALVLLGVLAGCESSEDEMHTDHVQGSGGTGAAAGGGGGSSGSGGQAGGAGESPVPGQVMTQSGPIAGEMIDHEGTLVHAFRGVPYAAPPVGELRWKPPQPVTPWTELRQATAWGSRSPQASSMLTENGALSEDCLNLNVLSRLLDASAAMPVMVFFHGGGLTIGTGNSPTYSHTALPAKGAVVVTVNQRLGPIGYFAHPALSAESEHNASGNYGVLDQIAALEWVRDNIAAFGGDPENVTIFGESGGGTKVLSCLGSPLCKGLFHRAIVQSGSRTAVEGAVTPREMAEERGVALATALGIAADDPEVLSKLRAFTWEEILAASQTTMFMTNISIDGWVFTQSVYDSLVKGEQADVPLIVGANEGEAAMLMADVPQLAAGMQSVSSPAYVYVFSYVPPGWQSEDCAAFHGLELAYVFGHLPGLETPTMRFLGMSAGCATDLAPLPNEIDRQVAENSMQIWLQFAKTGSPSVPGLIDWPAYTPEGDQYLNIGSALMVKMGVTTAGRAAPGIGGTEQ